MKNGCLMVIVVACLIGFLTALITTKPVVNAAEHFLTLLGEGKTNKAYQSTTTVFKMTRSKTSFFKLVRMKGLDNYDSVYWKKRSVSGNQGTLEGTVNLITGKRIRLSIVLEYEEGQWKVRKINMR